MEMDMAWEDPGSWAYKEDEALRGLPQEKREALKRMVDKEIRQKDIDQLPLSYESPRQTLYFRGKKVRFKKADNKQHEICAVLFRNPRSQKTKWQFADLLEKLHEDRVEIPKYDYAARRINKRVQSETGVEEFLIIQKCKTLQINPDYLMT